MSSRHFAAFLGFQAVLTCTRDLLVQSGFQIARQQWAFAGLVLVSVAAKGNSALNRL